MISIKITTAHHHSNNNPVDLLWEALKLRLPTTIVFQYKITIPTTIISWQPQLGQTDRQMDGRTDGRTDWTIHRAAIKQLQIYSYKVETHPYWNNIGQL